MNYKNDIVEKFLEKLSSTESMPGGGVASALVGAEGVSLGLKVCNLSLGKEKYKEYEELIKTSINALEKSRESFLGLMDEDAKNFKAMEAVYKMPRETDDDKKKRAEALENACKICCDVPIKIINEAASSATIITKLVGKTNVSAASDLKIGLMFLITTIHGAWDNIEINLKYIKDKEFKNKVQEVKKHIDNMTTNLNISKI